MNEQKHMAECSGTPAPILYAEYMKGIPCVEASAAINLEALATRLGQFNLQ